MENRTRINWIALSAGFALALVLAVPLLPSTRWIAAASYRQITSQGDIWSIGPHRVTGEDADAELARILLVRDVKKRHDLLTDFVDSTAPRADALAHWSRFSFSLSPQYGHADRIKDLDFAEVVIPYAQLGASLEPNNAYWPLVEAANWALADDLEAVAKALHRAKNCTTYNDYALDEAELIIEQLRKADRLLTKTEELVVYSSIVLPHYALFKNVAVWLPEDAITARGDIAITSVTMSRNADTAILHLVSLSIVRTAFLPDYRLGEKPSELEWLAARDLLLQDRPEDLTALTAAKNLAAGVVPRTLFADDQGVWNLALGGLYVRMFVNAVLWLAVSTVVVFLAPLLARLGEYPWVARFAPFAGFLILGWIVATKRVDASDYMLLWDWRIPEITVIGLLLGIAAIFEKYTKVVRWICFALSVIVFVLAVRVPVLLLPLAVIWGTFVFSWRKPDKWPMVVASAVAPCLLTLPIIIYYGASAEPGVWGLLVLLAILAVPVAWNANVVARKGQWAAISILVPCVLLIVLIRMNLVADASAGLMLDHEFRQVELLREALAP
ncbi:MAG: hypothetical protein IH944_03565 [Armatimonadetes bacterium]|nr:hypothetical protein [Armatimonadota bacterium]